LRALRNTICLVTLFAVFGATDLFAIHAKTSTRRSARTRKVRVRRAVWNPVLRGSRESLLRQNYEIDRLQLTRIANDDELLDLVERDELVAIVPTKTLAVNKNILGTRNYCRSWTRQFLEDLSEAYYREFRKPIQVTSAVRTVEQQKKLRRTNRNAAPIEGETASSHLAGLTIDIGKKGMSRKQRKWINAYLLPLQQRGIIEAAEERRQACYHIMVSERYMEYREEEQLAERVGGQ